MYRSECGFTLDHYFEVLEYAKKIGYAIISLREFQSSKKSFGKFIVLRHDIDFSLSYALEMAKLESDRGMRATYFILLHNDFYNVMAGEDSEILRTISKMGHEIALHIDTRFFDLKEPILPQIDREAGILENVTGKKVVSISQHYPKITPDMPEAVTLKYIYARDPKILKKMEYISDSGRNWRAKCMCNHIGKSDKLQILTHPLWWIATANSRDSTLDRFKIDAIKNTEKRVERFRQVVHSYVKEQLHQEQ